MCLLRVVTFDLIFLRFILRPLMTLIDGGRNIHFPDDSLESVCWIHIATPSRLIT